MKKKPLLFCLCNFLICFSSAVFAQKDFYIPKALVMPFHDRAHQLYLSAGVGGGYDENLSYSLSNHFALFATSTLNNGTSRRKSLFGDRFDVVKNDRVFTYGAGYFKPRKGRLNILEIYAGYGASKVNNYWFFTEDHALGDNYTQAHYSSVFCQAIIGRQTAKFEYGFAGRLSYSIYRDIVFYDSNPNTVYDKSSYKNMRGFNLDPAACIGYRFKRLSVNAQAGISAPISSSIRTIANTYTTYFNGATDVTIQEGTMTDIMIAAFGRLSLQYHFNMSKKKSRE